MRRTLAEPLPGAPEPWKASDMPAYRGRPPYVMTEMIAAEPALAERLMRRLAKDPVVEEVVDLIRRSASQHAPIVTTGCGSSQHAAAGLADLLNEALAPKPGREARPLPALEVVRRPLADGVLIGVSHEGGSALTNFALRAAADAGASTAIITVGGGSPGAEIAAHVIQTAELDQSWCHTVGYLSPLVVGLVLSARLAEKRTDAASVRAMLEAADDTRAAADAAAGLASVDRLIVAGAGPDLTTARELALKVAEGARLPAAAHELESLLHGHLAAANRWTGLVLVLTDATRAAPHVIERAGRLLSAARALGVTAAGILGPGAATEIAAADTPAGRLVLPRAGRVNELAASLIGSAMTLQLLTERLARARGVNPDTLGRENPDQAAAHA